MSIIVTEGHNASITCDYWGWPPPTVSWLQGSIPVDSGTPGVSFGSITVGNQVSRDHLGPGAELGGANGAMLPLGRKFAPPKK